MITRSGLLTLISLVANMVSLSESIVIAATLTQYMEPGIHKRRYSYVENDVAVLLTNYFMTTGTIQAIRFLTADDSKHDHQIVFGILRAQRDELDLFSGYQLYANFTYDGPLQDVTLILGTEMYEYNTSQIVWARDALMHNTPADVNVVPGDALLYYAAESGDGAVYFDIGEGNEGCFPVYTLPYSDLQDDGEVHIKHLEQVPCRMLSVEVDVCRKMKGVKP